MLVFAVVVLSGAHHEASGPSLIVCVNPPRTLLSPLITFTCDPAAGLL